MPIQFRAGIDLSGSKIANLAAGTLPNDAVTLAQLDALARGLDWKNSVRAATTTNITLSGTQTVDGTALAGGDRVLVKDQTTASGNGIYVVASGSWTRATDFDDSLEVTSAAAVAVETGTTNGDAAFILTTDGTITVGTTALTWSRLGGTGVAYVAGVGLVLVGSEFRVKPKTGGGLGADADGVFIDPAYTGLAKRYTQNVPAATSATITHNLGTKDVAVSVYRNADGAEILCEIVRTSASVVTLGFNAAPATDELRVVIVG